MLTQIRQNNTVILLIRKCDRDRRVLTKMLIMLRKRIGDYFCVDANGHDHASESKERL